MRHNIKYSPLLIPTISVDPVTDEGGHTQSLWTIRLSIEWIVVLIYTYDKRINCHNS